MQHCYAFLGLTISTAALAAVIACAPSSAPANPTVGVAATQVATAAKPAAATAVAAASPVATQVAAAASPAAATVVAGASPAATAIAGASPAAASSFRITGAQLGPTDSTVTIQNVGGSTVSLAGWRLRVGSATASLPSDAQVAPNEMLTIHTTSGSNTARDVFLGAEGAALASGLRPGVSIALVNPRGDAVTEFTLPG